MRNATELRGFTGNRNLIEGRARISPTMFSFSVWKKLKKKEKKKKKRRAEDHMSCRLRLLQKKKKKKKIPISRRNAFRLIHHPTRDGRQAFRFPLHCYPRHFLRTEWEVCSGSRWPFRLRRLSPTPNHWAEACRLESSAPRFFSPTRQIPLACK